MQIDWAHFTPAHALIGGAAIGLAAGATMLLLGRIAGISGIVGGLLPPRAGDADWRLAFIFGLATAPWALAVFHAAATPTFSAGAGAMAVAGLLVGFGSRLGSGCTSGHGVCGLSRLSRRSMAATAIFMATAMLTVFALRHFAL